MYEAIIMKNLFRAGAVTLCAVMAVCALSFNISAEDSGSSDFDPNTDKVWSEAVYMVNTDTDTIVFAKNENKRMYPASTTKIMTAIVALENIYDWEKKVDVPYDCFNEFNGDNEDYWYPSHADIQPLQDNLTYKDCIYALMLPSACEAANILAYNVGGGSMQKFIDMMNEKAQELGCTGTHFSNPHGLFLEDNYTTAHDMYLITRYALDNLPKFKEIVSTYEYEMPENSNNEEPYYIYSTISLLRPTSVYYYEKAYGIKTGTLDQSGRCLVSAAQDKYNYILVTLGAPIYDSEGNEYEEWYSMVDAINLYNWAFENFALTTVVTKEEQITEVDVELGENATHVILTPQEEYTALMPKSVSEAGVQKVFTTYDSVRAPVKKGDILGVMDVKFKGKTITTVNLVASRDVNLSQFDYYMQKAMAELDKPWLKISLVGIVLLLIAFIVTRTIENSKRRKLKQKEKRRFESYAKKR